MNLQPENATPHTVTSFEDELAQLNAKILELGGLVESQIAETVKGLSRRDSEIAEQVIRQDTRIDELEDEVNDLSVRILARRQPMANDLRAIVSAIRISGDLERLGDYTKNICKRALVINQSPIIEPVHAVPRMAARVQGMLGDVLVAYAEINHDQAMMVWEADQEVDELCNALFRDLISHMAENSGNIAVSTHLLFVAKNVERMGDLVTNIAERIYFIATGVPMRDERPKRDVTSVTDAEGEMVAHGDS